MDERIHAIRTGPRLVCEVVEPHDGISIVIRYAGNHRENLTLPRSVLPKLAQILTAIAAPSGTQKATQELAGS